MSKRKTLKAKILLFQSLKYLTLNRLIPACSLTAPYRSQCHLLTTGPHLCSQSHCMFTRESIRSLNYILQLIDTSRCQSNCVKNSRCQGKQHVLPATWYTNRHDQITGKDSEQNLATTCIWKMPERTQLCKGYSQYEVLAHSVELRHKKLDCWGVQSLLQQSPWLGLRRKKERMINQLQEATWTWPAFKAFNNCIRKNVSC